MPVDSGLSAVAACRASSTPGQRGQGTLPSSEATGTHQQDPKHAASAQQQAPQVADFRGPHLQLHSWAPLHNKLAGPNQELGPQQQGQLGATHSMGQVQDTPQPTDTAAAAAAEPAIVLPEQQPAASTAALQQQLRAMELEAARLRRRAQMAEAAAGRMRGDHVLLQGSNKKLCRRVQHLEAEQVKLQRVVQRRGEQVECLGAEVTRLQEAGNGMEETIRRLETDHSRQQQALNKHEEQQAALLAEKRSLQQQLEQERAEKAALLLENSCMQQRQQQQADMAVDDVIANLVDSVANSSLQQQMQQQAADIAELQAAYSGLQKELERRDEAISGLRAANSTQQQQLSSRECFEKVTALAAANNTLQQTQQQQQAEQTASLEAEIAALQQALGRHEGAAAQQQAEREQLQRDLQQLRMQEAAAARQLESVQTELRQTKDWAGSLIMERAELKDALEDKEAEVERLTADLTRLQGETKGQAAALTQLRAEQRAQQREQQRETKRLQGDIRRLNEEKEGWVAAQQQQQQRQAAVQMEGLQRVTKELQASVVTKGQEVEQWAVAYKELQQKKQEVEAANMHLDGQNWELQKQVLHQQQQLSDKEIECQQLSEELAQLTAAHQRQAQKLMDCIRDGAENVLVKALQGQVAQQQQIMAQLQRQLGQVQQHAGLLQQECDMRRHRSLAAAKVRAARLDKDIVAMNRQYRLTCSSSDGSSSRCPVGHTPMERGRGSSCGVSSSGGGRHTADSCASSSLPSSTATPPRRTTSTASDSWGQPKGWVQPSPPPPPPPPPAAAEEKAATVAEETAASNINIGQTSVAAAAEATAAATATAVAVATALLPKPAYGILMGGTRVLISNRWREAHQQQTGGVSNGQRQLLTPDGLEFLVTDWVNPADAMHRLGVGGEGQVFALPGYEVVDPAGGTVAAVAVKITALKGSWAVDEFYEGAEAAMAMAADMPQAMTVLAAWVQHHEGGADGSSSSFIGVMLMVRLKCTAWDLAWPKQQQQQQQDGQELGPAGPSVTSAAAAGGDEGSVSTAGTTRTTSAGALCCAVAAHRLGLRLATSEWQHGDYKPDNLMADGCDQLRIIDTTGVIRITPEQRRGGMLQIPGAFTARASTPAQLEGGNTVRDPLNDEFGAAASALMLLLGYAKYSQLLVGISWKLPNGEVAHDGCLYHPHRKEQQQHQLTRVKAALHDWLAEAGQGSNPTLLAWVAILVGQLHPLPEQRLPAAEAAARLEQLLPALSEVCASLRYGSA